MPKLFDDEDVDAVAIKVNPTFASNYQHRKEKEQLNQLSSKYSLVNMHFWISISSLAE